MDLRNRRLLVTGANGFIGRKVLCFLRNKGAEVYSFSRVPIDVTDKKNVSIEHISSLKFDTVIHLAGRAHASEKSSSDCELEFHKSNVELTLAIAKESLKAGVTKFIFMSSIGVHGTSNILPFNVSSVTNPSDFYSLSKLRAEQELKILTADAGIDLVIIRPPLVYGPDAPGNFGKLAKLAMQNLPLPFGAINNKRSLVALDNLVDLVVTCICHPNAANQTFLVSDDSDVSTTDLIKMLVRAAGKTPWLIPVPVNWLKVAAKLTGKQAVIDRLCGNLQIDITHTKQTLGWKPPITTEQGILRCFAQGDLC